MINGKLTIKLAKYGQNFIFISNIVKNEPPTFLEYKIILVSQNNKMKVITFICDQYVVGESKR